MHRSWGDMRSRAGKNQDRAAPHIAYPPLSGAGAVLAGDVA